MNLDDLLQLPTTERHAILATLSDALLIALADPRSLKPVKNRRAALRVIEAEAELYVMMRDAGTH